MIHVSRVSEFSEWFQEELKVSHVGYIRVGPKIGRYIRVASVVFYYLKTRR